MNVRPVATLAQSLLTNRAFDIEFSGYLSNHAKHAIVALDRLDASDERVQEWWNSYTKLTPYSLELHPIDTPWDQVQPCTAQQWEEWRGKKLHWRPMCAFLQHELLHRFHGDSNKLVCEYAPSLLSGMAGALTHGIIHLGWAIDASNVWMTVEGLAYLNFCYLGVDQNKITLVADDKTSSDNHPTLAFLLKIAKEWNEKDLGENWIEATKVKYDKTFHSELVPAGFQWQLSKTLHEAHEVATKVPSWLDFGNKEEEALLWKRLYHMATCLYLGTRDEKGNGNFLVLHAITSLWGVEHVCGVIGNDDTTRMAIRQYFSMLVCLLGTSSGGYPSEAVLEKAWNDYPWEESTMETKMNQANSDPVVASVWSDVVARGIGEVEEHNIKLVYVMRELWKRYGKWSGFLEAANSFTLTPNINPSKSEFKA